MVFKQLHHFDYDCKQDSKIAAFSLQLFTISFYFPASWSVFLSFSEPVLLHVFSAYQLNIINISIVNYLYLIG
jgi:hypothetical protein